MLFSAACEGERPLGHHEFSVHVSSDPGRAVENARVEVAGQVLGVTDPDGLIQLAVDGEEGARLRLQVTCPSDYVSPAEPLFVSLRQLQGEQRPEYSVTCPPRVRSVVVSVRAEGGADLPVYYLGAQVARTDEDGAAHIALRVPPDETIELVLDTTSQPRLRPRSPSARFRVGGRDAVFVFDQSFESVSKKKRVVVRRPPSPTGPVRIQSMTRNY